MPVVVKYGGNAMTKLKRRRAVAREIAALARDGAQPVVVHGGGPFIRAALDKAGLEHRFIRGLRVTTAESLPVIERVLTLLSKELAQDIGSAVGLSGRDAGVVKAARFSDDLGYVGRVTEVKADILHGLLGAELTPVLACLAENERGDDVLNVNADEVAGAVAGALSAPVVFLTDTVGVLDDPADPTSLLPTLSAADTETRVRDGRIAGGMIPKVEAALGALEQGASFAVIADGRASGTLTRAAQGSGGTRIVRE